jgi:hypothetical protein
MEWFCLVAFCIAAVTICAPERKKRWWSGSSGLE